MKSTRNRVKQEIVSFLDRNNISRNSVFLVAYSGGPDSTALLHILSEICPGKVHAVYINHGIRNAEELEKEEEIAGKICSRLKVPFVIKRIENGLIAKEKRESGRSTEELAREIRYSLLNSEADRAAADYICMGHNQDDLLETLIMRFFQGSGPEGLKGIKEVSGRIIRPLLGLEKRTILDYLDSIRSDFSLDSSNSEDKFLRNRIRQYLIPAVEKVFPGYKTALPRIIEKLGRDENDNYRILAEKIWQQDKNGFFLDADDFNACSAAQRMEIVLYAFHNFTEGRENERLPYKFIKVLEKSVETGPKRNILKGHGFRLYQDSGRIFWQSDIVDPAKKRYLIVVKGFNSHNSGRIEIMLPFAADREVQFEISRKVLDFPVLVRNRIEKDEISLSRGRTSLKKLISGWKIPACDKKLVPVMQTRKGIIGVIGSVFGAENILSADCTGNDRIMIFFKGRTDCAEK